MSEEKNPFLDGIDDDQVLSIFQMAQAATPFMNLLVQMHQARMLRDFQSAKYEHSKEIMQLKAIDCAVQQQVRDFRGLVSRAQSIMERRNKANDPAAKEQQRLDKQGFGL